MDPSEPLADKALPPQRMPQDLLELVGSADTASVCDADKMTRVVSGELALRSVGEMFAGPAFTVRCRSDFLAVLYAVETAPVGSVVVVDGGGEADALAGEIIARTAEARGLQALLIDGGLRDLRYISKSQLPVHSRHISPVAATNRRAGELQVPVVCGGVAVLPGDLVMGDPDGIVVLDPSRVEDVLRAAAVVRMTEGNAMSAVSASGSLNAVLNLAEHYAAVQQGDRASVLSFNDAAADLLPLAGTP